MNREELIIGHMKLAEQVARSFKGCGILPEDLKQNAYEALIRAADTFEESKGMFFHWAKACIKNHIALTIANESATVRVPATTFSLKTKIYKVTKQLESELHRTPSSHEIADRLGIDTKDVDMLLGGKAVPLHGNEGKVNYIDVLKSSIDVENEYIRKEELAEIFKKKILCQAFIQLAIWPRFSTFQSNYF